MAEYTLDWFCDPNVNPCGYAGQQTLAMDRVTESAYLAGHKVLPTGVRDRLGSMRDDGHYSNKPYGENFTGGNSDGFATYYQDSSTQLHYADQRYYNAIYGRFSIPDPTMSNVNLDDPLTWNAYTYANGDPANSSDPSGLVTCGDLTINGGAFKGQTVSQVMTGTTGNDNLAELIWHEDGTIYPQDLADPQSYYTDQLAVGTAVMNQLAVDDGKMTVYQNGNAVCPLGQCLNRNLGQIIQSIATYRGKLGMVQVFNSSGQMVDGASTLKGILDTDAQSGLLVMDSTGNAINIGCEGVLSSINAASDVLSGVRETGTGGLALLFWNKQSASVPFYPGYVGVRSPRAVGHTFWGLYTTPTPPEGAPAPPVRVPPIRRRK
jgi:RHS repeat-associated protein